MRIDIDSFISGFSILCPSVNDLQPWEITANTNALVDEMILKLDANEYSIDNGVAIHKSATVETSTVLKAPVIIGENCFVAATAYLRGGVYLGKNSSVGPGCEIKSSLIFQNTTVAHFNFIGDSIIGNDVNVEAGAVFANRYNERTDKRIRAIYNGALMETLSEKFGGLVGDGSRIGANAVLSPGTILPPDSKVKRLALVEQVV
jgi:UDP-N-acetylglucosamine diphosphorylase / glucose-1-phosphate thymidylyltransferase / UDP-N-acetylgalactosamine diphosphorylase / glucosamine-1-phosphate N-acetyltransferase / galactosamine-1-phosphate N-acetyltransferase